MEIFVEKQFFTWYMNTLKAVVAFDCVLGVYPLGPANFASLGQKCIRFVFFSLQPDGTILMQAHAYYNTMLITNSAQSREIKNPNFEADFLFCLPDLLSNLSIPVVKCFEELSCKTFRSRTQVEAVSR